MSTMQADASGGMVVEGGATSSGDGSEPTEPADYEFAGVFDGDMRFLSCTRCGALVAVDGISISRHNDSHAHQDQQRAEEPQPRPAAAPANARTHEGADLAQLLRDALKEEIRLRGITQVKLADMAEVSQKHLSQILTANAVGSMELWSKMAEVIDRRWSVSLHDISD